MKKQVAFTLRFDPDLYQRIKMALQRDGGTVTGFVQDAVARKLAEEEAAALFSAFTIVGKDMDEASVEFAGDAQRAIALGGE